MTNPSGTAPRPVIHLLELLSFQTATFAEFRLARERVGYGDEGPLFRAHGVPLNLGAPTRPSGPRPPNGHSMALIFFSTTAEIAPAGSSTETLALRGLVN